MLPSLPLVSRQIRLALLCLLAGLSASPGAVAQSVTRVDLGLSAPLGAITSVDEFSAGLASKLVWTVHASGSAEPALRLNVVRLDRGRVTSSGQSTETVVSRSPEPVASTLGAGNWRSIFPECCVRTEDPPVRVTALSGTEYMDAETLEGAVAALAREASIGRAFGLSQEMEISWGRQFVLVISASSSGSIETRPLILLVDRL